MSPKIGRNDPCPCGSGLKYKKCCLGKEERRAQLRRGPQFRFEPGSYSVPEGFVPSVACLKQVEDDEHYHYVLVRAEDPCSEDQASEIAHRDLDAAASAKGRVGSPAAFATSLREAGYVRLSDFQIADSSHDPPHAERQDGDNIEALQRVCYRRGFIDDLSNPSGLRVTEFGCGELPDDIAKAIQDNDLLDATGVYGDPLAGDPVQVDELTLESETHRVEITVYNRAIMLFKTDDDIYPRVHRVCCLIDQDDPAAVQEPRRD